MKQLLSTGAVPPSQPSARAARVRAETMQASILIAVMAAVALLAGFGAAHSVQDPLVSIAAGGMAVLMLIAVMQMFGLLGRR